MIITIMFLFFLSSSSSSSPVRSISGMLSSSPVKSMSGMDSSSPVKSIKGMSGLGLNAGSGDCREGGVITTGYIGDEGGDEGGVGVSGE